MLTFGVLIGRFQPFHQGHLYLAVKALDQCDQLIIAIGSAGRARSTVNPFTFDERTALMRSNLETYADRIHFVAIPDVFYDEAYWLNQVKSAVFGIAQGAEVTLFGHSKDESSYYLREFPEWRYVEFPDYNGISATPLRLDYLEYGLIDHLNFPAATEEFLTDFKKSAAYTWLHNEANVVKHYKASWSTAPYPPIFVTTDAIVVCQSHILLIKRKDHPGKGLYALPGGFVEPGEWLQNALVRELIEETQIDVTAEELKASLITFRPFDYPTRSQIGRVITHAGLIKLANHVLPKITGSDDAGEALWVKLENFTALADQLYDDHFQIVQYWQRQGLLNG
jgi:bifunctional NMN adenylyltransferase/nudix hydrolase